MTSRLLAVVLAASAVLTACSPDDAEQPLSAQQGQWIDAFCGGVLPGTKAAQELQAQDPANPAAVKESYLKLIAANTTAFTAAEKRLEELGPPSDELKGLHDRLVRYIGESARSYAAAEKPVQALEPNAQFWENAEKVLAEKSQVSKPEELRATFDELGRKPKYAQAMSKSVPCTELQAKK